MSRGKLMPTLSRVMFMPVSSDAMPTAFCMAQFCIGGMYSSITSSMGMSKRAPSVMPVHFNMRRIMFKGIGGVIVYSLLVFLLHNLEPAKAYRQVQVP